MISESDDLYVLKGRDLEKFGWARARDLAYDSVQELWRRRKSEGWTQVRLADNIGRDTGWLSKYLRGPGNWTFRIFGAVVEGLGGVIEIKVRAAEDVVRPRTNYGPYDQYVKNVERRPPHPATSPQSLNIDFFSKPPSKPSATSSVGELH